MAVQTGIPILPVVCNGAFKVLPKKTLAFRPGHIKLNICPPIPTQGLSEKDVPELMSRTRQAILAKLRLDYDPFLSEEPCTWYWGIFFVTCPVDLSQIYNGPASSWTDAGYFRLVDRDLRPIVANHCVFPVPIFSLKLIHITLWFILVEVDESVCEPLL